MDCSRRAEAEEGSGVRASCAPASLGSRAGHLPSEADGHPGEGA